MWDGDVATAKCAGDHRRDERLRADDVRSFHVVLSAFMEGVAEAMGLGRPDLIAPGLWSLGMLADGRIIVAAPTRVGIRQPGLVGAIRLAHKEGTVILVGPELPTLMRGNLAEQNIHHVQPIHALLPPVGDLPLALDVARLPDGRAGRYSLVLTVETRTRRHRALHHAISLDDPLPDGGATVGAVLSEADGYGAWMGQQTDAFADVNRRLDLERIADVLTEEDAPLCAALARGDVDPARHAGLSRTTAFRRVREMRLRLRAAGIAPAA